MAKLEQGTVHCKIVDMAVHGSRVPASKPNQRDQTLSRSLPSF
jgi:hypothetical protein